MPLAGIFHFISSKLAITVSNVVKPLSFVFGAVYPLTYTNTTSLAVLIIGTIILALISRVVTSHILLVVLQVLWVHHRVLILR